MREDPDFIEKERNHICASIQQNLVSTLMDKLILASHQTGIRELGIAGGVSANRGLRMAMEKTALDHGWKVYIPSWAYCTDNAAMIAMAAHHQFLAGDFVGLDAVPMARMPWPQKNQGSDPQN